MSECLIQSTRSPLYRMLCTYYYCVLQIINGLTKELEISRLEKEAMVTELHSPSPYVAELTVQLESLKHQNRCKINSFFYCTRTLRIYLFIDFQRWKIRTTNCKPRP